MNRGIIVEIKSRHWIVMTPDGEFRKIRRASEAGLGDEVRLPDQSPVATRRTITLMAAASVILLLLALPGLMRSYSEVAVYLAIDFNPSLELGIDKHERVLELRSWNEDGAAMIQGMDYENIAVQDVLGQIVERARDGHYLTEDTPEIIVTSVRTGTRPDTSLETRVAGQVSLILESALNLTVTVLSAPSELRDEAAEQGVTPGKMAVYLLAKHTNDPILLKELQQFSIHQAVAAHGGMESIVRQFDTASAREVLKRLLLQELAQEGEKLPAPESSSNPVPQTEPVTRQPAEPRVEDTPVIQPPPPLAKPEQGLSHQPQDQRESSSPGNTNGQVRVVEEKNQSQRLHKHPDNKHQDNKHEDKKQEKRHHKKTQQESEQKSSRGGNFSKENPKNRSNVNKDERPEKQGRGSKHERKGGQEKDKGKKEEAKERGRPGNKNKSDAPSERKHQAPSNNSGPGWAA